MPNTSEPKSTHTHAEREELLLKIRTQTSVEPVAAKPKKGAIVTYGTVVFGALAKAHGGSAAKRRVAQAEKARPYPLELSHEPGFFPPGTTKVTVGDISIPGVKVKGYWAEIIVGTPTKIARCGYESATGSEAEIARVLAALPQPTNVDVSPATTVKVQARRLIRHGKNAYAELFDVAKGIVNSIAWRRFDRHCQSKFVTPDEVRAAGYVHVTNAINLFASVERPQHTFTHHIKRNAERDMERQLNQFEPEKEDTRLRRHQLDKFRHLSNDPVELAALMNQELHQRRLRKEHPSWSTEEVARQVELDAKAGTIHQKHSVDAVTRLLDNPPARTVSLDAPIGHDTDESAFALADKVAVHHDRDVTDYSFDEALDAMLAAHPELTSDHFLAFIHKMGLVTETDDVTRPAAIPTTGPSGKAAFMLLEPFLLEAESWTRAEHRNNARRRAYEVLTDMGRVKDPHEIANAWRGVLMSRKGNAGPEQGQFAI